MSVIHLLPDSVANQIAAGEVIQRPASVVKELMENSIDAGASEIRVMVQDAGRTQIQVIDDGCGMNETDARLAFERHATSKIQTAQDLYNLGTMGFRGEALASIAAVAQVELLTRQEGEELGVKIVINGSDVDSQEPCATPKGSRFCVKNLFFNVPARRRFLKSDTAEMRHVCSEFLRVALAHPGVGVSLASNGTTLYNLPAGNVKQRVAGVAGMSMARQLLPIDVQTSIVRIGGFIGTPETARKTGGDQYFFANDRYMRSAYFNKAVTDAYKGIIPADQTPAYYIYLSVDPRSLDVNVHPQKTEIKFDDDQAIWKILNSAISTCLNDNNILPQIDFDSGERIEIPRFDPTASQTTDTYNPFVNESRQGAEYAGSLAGRATRADISGWQAIYSSAASASGAQQGDAPGVTWSSPQTGTGGVLLDLTGTSAGMAPPKLTQYKGRYILCQSADGLTIIDQHRASERVLFDRLAATIGSHAIESQSMLFPYALPMGAEDLCIVSELEGELAKAGISASVQADRGCVEISSTPAVLGISAVCELLQDLTESCRSGEVDVRQDVTEAIVRRMASHGATPYGKELTDAEMRDLHDRLMQSAEKGSTPAGRPTMRTIADADIDSLFK